MTESLIKGLDKIQEMIDRQSQDFEDTPKAKWVKIKAGEQVKVWFLQEFDENSPHYSPKAGTLSVLVEHSSPADFRKKALCTKEDGGCVGCEQNRLHPKTGWGQRLRLYCNVLVISKDPAVQAEVQILSQALGGKSISPTLTTMAREYKTITQVPFIIKRTGAEMNNTSYSLLPLPATDNIPNPDNFELYDLEEVCTRRIPYEEQAEFYDIQPDAPTGESEEDFGW